MLLKGRKGAENTYFIGLSHMQAMTRIHKDVSGGKRKNVKLKYYM